MMLMYKCVLHECDVIFFFKQKTAYEMRISYWSSDGCSSDLGHPAPPNALVIGRKSPHPQAGTLPRSAWSQRINAMRKDIVHLPSAQRGELERVQRSDERRVGKEWGSMVRSRWL